MYTILLVREGIVLKYICSDSALFGLSEYVIGFFIRPRKGRKKSYELKSSEMFLKNFRQKPSSLFVLFRP